MSDELSEQWKRLLAAGKVRWMPGMLPERNDRVVHVGESGRGKYITLAYIKEGLGYGCGCELELSDLAENTPDWTDPATLGCLLAMAREATGDLFLSVTAGYKNERIMWHDSKKTAPWCGLTEAAALLAAIEAA